MPAYIFRFPANLASLPVSVYSLVGGVRGSVAATGTTGSDGIFTATLSVGDYLAVVKYLGTETGVREGLSRAPSADAPVTLDDLNDSTSDATAALRAAFGRSDLLLAKRDGACVGDGTTDDTAAISAAMDAANTAGKVLFFEPGNYVSARITKSYAPKIGAAPGVTITVASTVANGWLWTFQGSIAAHQSLTGNMAQDSFTLPVSTTGWAAGDLLLIGSNALVLDEAYPATVAARYIGQLSEIQSVDSSAQATLFESAYAAFNTTDTAFAAKVTPIENAQILGGITFVNPYRATKLIGFLWFQYARNVEFDVRGDGASAAGVGLAHCFRVTGRSRHRNYRDDGSGAFGYGVAVEGSTAHGRFDIAAVGGTGNAFNTTGIDNDWGEPNDHLVTGSAAGGTGGFATHPAGRNIAFRECHVSGTGPGFAFAARSDGVKFINCTVDRAGGGIYLYDNARNITVEGCVFREIVNYSDTLAKGRGIVFAQSAAAGDRNIVIQNNRFDGVDSVPVYLSDNAADLRGIEVIDNHFKNFGRTGTQDAEWSAVYSAAGGAGMVRWTIKGNRCSDSQGTPTSKYLFNCNGATGTADIFDNVLSDGVQLTSRVLQGANRHFGRNVISGKQVVPVSDYTGIGSGTFDCLTTDVFFLPLTANRTIALNNPTQGQLLEIHLQQDATGSRTVTWPAAVLFPGGTAPTLTTTANKTDVFRFRYRGANWYLLGQALNL